MRKEKPSIPEHVEEVTRMEYREILLARMAGGDLYAYEQYRKFREVDIKFDAFREKPIYGRIASS